METVRITAEVDLVYVWLLNPMKSNTESIQDFGPFYSEEDAIQFIESEKVEQYSDTGPDMFNGGDGKHYRKSFRKGGPLEWMNPPYSYVVDQHSTFGQGLFTRYSNIRNIQRL